MPQLEAEIAAEIRASLADSQGNGYIDAVATVGPLTESQFTVTTAPGDDPGDGQVFDVIVRRREQ